jgi:hypothetical protein
LGLFFFRFPFPVSHPRHTQHRGLAMIPPTSGMMCIIPSIRTLVRWPPCFLPVFVFSHPFFHFSETSVDVTCPFLCWFLFHPPIIAPHPFIEPASPLHLPSQEPDHRRVGGEAPRQPAAAKDHKDNGVVYFDRQVSVPRTWFFFRLGS